MRINLFLIGLFAFTVLPLAKARDWTLKSGKILAGDYVSSGTTTLVVKTDGTNCFIKLSNLSSNDLASVRRLQNEKKKAALRKARQQFIDKYEPLRVIDGQLYDFSVLYQLTSDGTWTSGEVAKVFDDWTVHGEVIQVLKDGLLIHDSGLDSAVFLKDYRYQSVQVDGSPITAFALVSGRYSYENTIGAKKTIFAFDCGRTFNPKKDKFTTKTVLSYSHSGIYYAPRKFVIAVSGLDKLVPTSLAHSSIATKVDSADAKETMDHDATNSHLKASGTGFFITPDGYLISNYHVVKDAAKVRLQTDAGTVDAKVVQVDAADDLALLKAQGHFAPLPVESSRSVALGSTVATVGFPDPGLQGFSPKLAKGIIAGLAGASDDARYFQISVPVQPGNSGGALVNSKGNVVGIVSAKLNPATALAASGALPENVNYAVKSSFLLSFLEASPTVDSKLKSPNMKKEQFEDVVKQAKAAAVLVLVY